MRKAASRFLLAVATAALPASRELNAEPALEAQAAEAARFFDMHPRDGASAIPALERVRGSAKVVAASVSTRVQDPPAKDEPAFDKLNCAIFRISCHSIPGAKYKPVVGRLFEKGEGDARAVSPTDIAQGKLFDCYFLASVGAIARKDPMFLRKLITRNRDGTFSVKLHKTRLLDPFGLLGTTEETVTVSDQFPLRRGRPVFAGYGDELDGKPELWPMILEKAYAALGRDASYNRMSSGGFAGIALQALTGKRTVYRLARWTSIDELAALDRQGYAIVVNTTPTRHETLSGGHAYWVHRVDPAAKTVTLANPYGPTRPLVTIGEDEFRRAMIFVQAAMP